jgi:hypothetical protein
MAETKFIIRAQNEAQKAINEAKKDLFGLGEAAGEVSKALTSAFTVAAVAEGLKKIGDATFEMTKEFGEGERFAIQLKTALGGNEASFERLSGLIEASTKKTLSSKDSIEQLVGEIATLGRSDADVEKLTNAAIVLSNATGKDLSSAFQVLNATYDGSVGKLGKLIPELKNLTKEQLSNGSALDLVISKMGAVSDAMGEGYLQRLQNLKNGYAQLRENIGESSISFFGPIISGIDLIIARWNDAYAAQKKIVDAMNSGDLELANLLSRQSQITKEKDDLASERAAAFNRNEDVRDFDKRYDALTREYALNSLNLKSLKDAASLKAGSRSEGESPGAEKSVGGLGFYGAVDSGFNSEGNAFAVKNLVPKAFGGNEETAGTGTWMKLYQAGNEASGGMDEWAAKAATFSSAWSSALNTISDQWQGWDSMIANTMLSIENGLGNAFKSLGQSLVSGGNAWKNLGKVALETLSQILSAIGSQLMALAAVKLFGLIPDPAGAAGAAAAGAAAFTAAGMVGAIGSGSDTGSSGSSASVSGSSTSTSYSGSSGGGGDLIINVNAPVYGDGGIEKLADEIRYYMDKRNYYLGTA